MNKADANKSVHSIRMTNVKGTAPLRISDTSARSKSPLHRKSSNDDAVADIIPRFSSAEGDQDTVLQFMNEGRKKKHTEKCARSVEVDPFTLE